MEAVTSNDTYQASGAVPSMKCRRYAKRATLASRPSGSSGLVQPLDDLVVDAMHRGGEVRVGRLCSAVADDEIAIGKGGRVRIGHPGGADPRLLLGVIQTSHF
jgi:hypothetical protein